MRKFLSTGVTKSLFFVAVLLCGTIAHAELMTPIDVANHSGTEAAPYTAEKIIDGIAGPGGARNMAVFTDDDPSTPGTYGNPVNPISGHVILDLGESMISSALKIWARNDTAEALLPESVDLFYYVDDDWSNNAVVDDIEGDADIVSVWSGTLQNLVMGADQTVTFTSSATGRYLGIRVNASYGWDSFQINEVAVDATDVPEPGTLALLFCGVMSVSMLVRRKR